MNAAGSDVDSPFLAGADPDMAVHHRPPVDDDVMRRLRTPFNADPLDELEQQPVVSFDEDNYRR
jgi:hypothetical protein